MDATLISSPNVHHPPCFKIKSFSRINERSNDLYHGNRHRLCTRRNRNRISAIGEVSAITSDQIDPPITWQIVVGSIAGVTPFVVAGIEFSKRIVAQKQCEQCGGSGLVLMEEEYIRCPNCELLVGSTFYKKDPTKEYGGNLHRRNFPLYDGTMKSWPVPPYYFIWVCLRIDVAGGFLPWQSWKRFFSG